MEKWLKRLAIAATLIMFLVMIAGSLVTKTGSAMGCGNDWPLCNGKFVPEYTLQSMIEYMHRMVTGLAGMIVLAFAGLSWWRHRGNREVLGLAGFAVFFILLESALGASAVLWPPSAPVLALHFGFSLLAFAGVLLLTLFILQRDKMERLVRAAVSSKFRLLVWVVTVYAYGVVYLGAYVRHTNASMACTEWPLCNNGQLVGDLHGLVGIQMAHRAGAMLLFVLLLIVMLGARRYKESRRDIYVAANIAFALVTAQVLSGGFVVLTYLHLYATILHSAIITCLFGVLCYLCLQTLKKPKR
jgi:heme a synthase